MEEKLRIFSLVLLLLVGSSAIGGGWMLVRDPSGYSMELPIELLSNTPFNYYLIPGIILLVAVGFFSISVATMGARNPEGYNIGFSHPLDHIPLYTISLVLIAIGFTLKKRWPIITE